MYAKRQNMCSKEIAKYKLSNRTSQTWPFSQPRRSNDPNMAWPFVAFLNLVFQPSLWSETVSTSGLEAFLAKAKMNSTNANKNNLLYVYI